MRSGRAAIEALLRDRKLDTTLTSARPWVAADDAAATGEPAIDTALKGGLRRGHLSEIVGPRSSGRTTLLCRVLASATARGEVVALIDTCDRFDPASAADAGVDLSRLLWVRDQGDAARALKAATLILQAGGFGIVAFDLADMPLPAICRFPHTTWMRLSRIVAGSQTVAVLLAAERIARSPGGVTIALDAVRDGRAVWQGSADRARVLRPLTVQPRIVRSAPSTLETPSTLSTSSTLQHPAPCRTLQHPAAPCSPPSPRLRRGRAEALRAEGDTLNSAG